MDQTDRTEPATKAEARPRRASRMSREEWYATDAWLGENPWAEAVLAHGASLGDIDELLAQK